MIKGENHNHYSIPQSQPSIPENFYTNASPRKALRNSNPGDNVSDVAKGKLLVSRVGLSSYLMDVDVPSSQKISLLEDQVKHSDSMIKEVEHMLGVMKAERGVVVEILEDMKKDESVTATQSLSRSSSVCSLQDLMAEAEETLYNFVSQI